MPIIMCRTPLCVGKNLLQISIPNSAINGIGKVINAIPTQIECMLMSHKKTTKSLAERVLCFIFKTKVKNFFVKI